MVTAFDSSKKLSTGRSTLGPTLSHGQELWVVTEEMRVLGSPSETG